MKKIYLLSYFSFDSKQLYSSPAACNKLEYIIECLNKEGFQTETISSSYCLSGSQKGCKIAYPDNRNTVVFFSSKAHKGLGKWLNKQLLLLKVLLYILCKIEKKSTMIVYHSTSFYYLLKIAKKIKKLKLLLEVEEVYSSLKDKQRGIKKEINSFSLANGFVFPSEVLNEKINTRKKPYIIIYGAYKTRWKKELKINDSKIHCVYAGTFNRIKGGCQNAIQAAIFLNSSFVMHVLGFGTEKEEEEIKCLIKEVNAQSDCSVIFEGEKKGKDFFSHISRFHVGLATQNASAAFNDTSFPSKVLTYLSAGLSVVSSNVEVLRKSRVSNLISFCKTDSPKGIAEAIKKAQVIQDESFSLIDELDQEARKNLRIMVTD